MPYDEDEDNLTQEDLAAELDGTEEAPAQMALPPAPPQAAPMPVAAPGAGSPQPHALLQQDLLRRLLDTQNQAEESKGAARLGEAFSNLGSSIAKATPEAKAQNAAPFVQFAKDADTASQNKVLRDYLLRSGQQQNALTIANQASKDRNRRTDVMEANNKRNNEGSTGLDPETSAKADSELGVRKARVLSSGSNKSYSESIRRGNNLKGIFKLYPDLNNMPANQVATVAEELSGFINGGAPTVVGSHGALPSSFQSNWNALMSKAGGAPKPAQLGAFLKEISPYVDDVIKLSKKHLYKQTKNLTNSYQSRLTPDAYKRHLQEMEEELGEELPPSPPGMTYSDPEKERRFQEFRTQAGQTKTKTASAK